MRIGNADEFLYLGGNEQSTHKFVSELLGKATIDTNTYGKSSGRSGNYSTNYQISGRELLTPDEVRMLDNRYALLFVRGERLVMDLKYDILKHPNVKLTADGGKPPYIHGEPTQAVATLVFDDALLMNAESMETVSTSYELLSDEDLEEIRTNHPMKLFKKNEKKATQKLPMGRKARKAFVVYAALVLCMVFGTTTAFAASDPITVVNNLSNFIFGLIRTVGMIMLGFGIVQVGLSLKSHDPSQRANGFLTLAGGVVITFAKEILTLITG